MATNVQKTPLARSLLGVGNRAATNQAQRLGKTIPCSVTQRVSSKIVEVKFEIIDPNVSFPPATMPIFGSEYIREPIQPGCKGMAIAPDYFLGQMSGLGTGTATMNEQPNLSCLVFMPIGNASFTDFDHNEMLMYGGSDGFVIYDSASANATIQLTSSKIALTCAGHSIVIDSSGVVIDGKVFLLHEHTGVQSGLSDTGPVA